MSIFDNFRKTSVLSAKVNEENTTIQESNIDTMNTPDKQRLLTAFVSYGCNVQSCFHFSPKINSFELFYILPYACRLFSCPSRPYISPI